MLIEKPLALSLKKRRTWCRSLKPHDVPLMVGLNFRYLAVTRELKSLLARGTVGHAGIRAIHL